MEETMSAKFGITILLLASLLAGCNFSSAVNDSVPSPSVLASLEFIQPSSSPVAISTFPPPPVGALSTSTPRPIDQAVLQRSAEVIAALQQKDMQALSQLVHPHMGLRFSPYAAVKASDQLFPA
jgi:hypothetical protein